MLSHPTAISLSRKYCGFANTGREGGERLSPTIMCLLVKSDTYWVFWCITTISGESQQRVAAIALKRRVAAPCCASYGMCYEFEFFLVLYFITSVHLLLFSCTFIFFYLNTLKENDRYNYYNTDKMCDLTYFL